MLTGVMNDTDDSLWNPDADGTKLKLPHWAHTTRVVLFLLIFTFGVPGNTVVLLLQARNKSKTSTDWLVTAMAGTDLCGAGISCSLYVFLETSKIFKVPSSSALCQGHFYCIYVTSVSSALLLCAVAVDRYSKACRPHSKLISINRAKMVGLITTTASALLYTPSFMIYEYDIHDEKCDVRSEYQNLDLIVKLSMALSLVILFSLTMFSYINIAVAIRQLRIKKNDKNTSSRIRRKQFDTKRKFLKRNKISPKPSTSYQKNEHDDILKHDRRVRVISRKNAFLIENRKELQRQDQDIFGVDYKTETILQTMRFKNRITDQSAEECVIETNHDKTDEGPSKTLEKGMILTKQKANTTTKIMFLLTVLFIMTWLLNILSGIVVRASEDHRAVFIIFRCLHPAYMLNFVSNPFFYVCLSSKYRSSVYRMICGC